MTPPDKPPAGSPPIKGNFGAIIGNTEDASKATSKGVSELSNNVDTLGRQVGQTTKNLDGFNAALKENSDKSRTYVEWLKAQDEQLKKNAQSLKENAFGLTTLHGQMNSLIGSAGGFLDKLKGLINLQNIETVALKRLEIAQKSYTSSLNFSSASGKRAGQELQKSYNTIESGQKNAIKLALKYRMTEEGSGEALKKLSNETYGRFRTQIGAYKDSEAVLNSLTNTTVAFSLAMGIDTAEAAAFMNSQMRSSNKTIKEVETETKKVAIVMDDYTKKITNLGGESHKTALIERNELLKVVMETSAAFRSGILDVTNYTKILGNISVETKKLGYTTNETMDIIGGMRKFVETSGGGMQSLFAIQATQRLLSNPALIKDQKTRERAEFVNRQYKGNVLGIEAGQEALRGSPELIRETLMGLKQQTEGNPMVRTQLIRQATGLSEFKAAGLSKMLDEGKLTEATKEFGEAAAKNAETANEKFDKIEKTLVAGLNPSSPYLKRLQDQKLYKNYAMDLLQTDMKWVIRLLIAQGVISGLAALPGIITSVKGAIGGIQAWRTARAAKALAATEAAAAAGTAKAVAGGTTAVGTAAGTAKAAETAAALTKPVSMMSKVFKALPWVGVAIEGGVGAWDLHKTAKEPDKNEFGESKKERMTGSGITTASNVASMFHPATLAAGILIKSNSEMMMKMERKAAEQGDYAAKTLVRIEKENQDLLRSNFVTPGMLKTSGDIAAALFGHKGGEAHKMENDPLYGRGTKSIVAYFEKLLAQTTKKEDIEGIKQFESNVTFGKGFRNVLGLKEKSVKTDNEILKQWEKQNETDEISSLMGGAGGQGLEALKATKEASAMSMNITASTEGGGVQEATINAITNSFDVNLPGGKLVLSMNKVAAAFVNAGSPSPSTKTIK